MNAAAGRADLLRAVGALGEDGLTRMARILGYREEGVPATRDEPVAPPVALRLEPAPAAATRPVPIPFWRLDRVEHLEQATEVTLPEVPVLGLGDIGPPGGAEMPRPAPIVPWSRLWPALQPVLRSTREGHELDATKLVDRWCRGEMLHRLPRVEAREIVLTLGDLGFYGGGAERAFWAQLGRRLRRGGVRARALVPCPAGRWGAELARLWMPVDWSAPLRTAARRGLPLEAAEVTARAERLLRLVAPAVRVEPGLLREVRRLLPAQVADVGTEADAWAHPQAHGDSSIALQLEPALAAVMRESFRAERGDLKAKVAAVLRRWHVPLAREIWFEELLGLALAGELPEGTLTPEELEAAWRFMLRLSRTQVEPRLAEARLVRATRSYLLRSGMRLPAQVWRDPVLGEALGRAWVAASVEQAEVALPPGVSPSVLDPAPDRYSPRRWTAWHEGELLRFRPEIEQPPEGLGGSPLATFTAAVPELAIATSREAWATPCRLDLPSPAHPLPRAESLLLRSDHHQLELRRFERPPWASAAGRDRFGLWVEVEVRGARFRMRWIPPGRFLMGSPESEAGRWDDEGPQHEVMLTKGFWLGETPCTQALWQAVTGENPSRFKTPGRPVETVSWEQCEKFFESLEGVVPGLAARFPTEAEWEYACRAGTTTSTYAGEMEILGANNAPILHDIAWYGGNSGLELDLAEGYDSSGWKDKQFAHQKAATRIVNKEASECLGSLRHVGQCVGMVRRWLEQIQH